MPDIADGLWSEVDDLNSDVAPNGFPPGMPAYIDHIGRMMMGAIKRSWARGNPVYETTGTDDAYQISPDSGSNKINLYELISARIDRANTTIAPTLQYGMTNPRTIVKVTAESQNAALAVGDLVAGAAAWFWYDGTNWVLANPPVRSGDGIGDMLASVYDPQSIEADAFERANHTGTQSADTLTDGTTNKAYTATEKTKLAGIAASADVTSATNVASSIHGVASKATPVDADEIGLIDSAASNALKKLTWANLKATLKAYFDTLYVSLAGATMTGPLNLADQLLQRPTIKDYGETVNALGTVGTSPTIDLESGNVVTATVAGTAPTFAFSNPSASGKCCSFTLILTNGGLETIVWPASVKWLGDAAPTLNSAGVDVLIFFTVDGGTTWYGASAGTATT